MELYYMSEIREGKMTGHATKVVIKSLDFSGIASKVCCELAYEKADSKQQESHAKRVFSAWHERLRPALDDVNRKMNFELILSFNETRKPWKFKLDNSEPVFQQIHSTTNEERPFAFWLPDKNS